MPVEVAKLMAEINIDFRQFVVYDDCRELGFHLKHAESIIVDSHCLTGVILHISITNK